MLIPISTTHLEQLPWRRRDVIAVALPRAAGVPIGGVGHRWIEDGILEVVQHVRVGGVDILAEALALRTLGLCVVLPEGALVLLVGGTRQNLLDETRATRDRLCRCEHTCTQDNNSMLSLDTCIRTCTCTNTCRCRSLSMVFGTLQCS